MTLLRACEDGGYNEANMSLSDMEDTEDSDDDCDNEESDTEINGLSERNGNHDQEKPDCYEEYAQVNNLTAICKRAHVESNCSFTVKKSMLLTTRGPKSWENYKDKWRTLMCVWQRMELLDEDERPPYRLTTKQAKRWGEFRTGVKAVVSGSDKIGRYTDDRLQRACLDMVVSMLDHHCRTETIMKASLSVRWQ